MALDDDLPGLLRLAGAGQLALAAGSLAIPRVLRWREALAPASRLVRQVFWVYAGYILATNVALGLVSLIAADALTEDSVLGAGVCGYAFAYWGARVLLQFLVLDFSEIGGSWLTTLAQRTLDVLFLALTAVYGAALLHHVTGT